MAFSSFSGALNNWMTKFNSVERMNFVNYGMNSLFSLLPGTLKLQVLRAAVDHWDPKLHVFRFGYEELCPTIEEFSVLLECRNRDSVVIPTPLVSARKQLMNFLGLTEKVATSFVEGDELNILRIIDKLQPDDNLFDRKHQSRRQFAMCICLLARYLLVSSDGSVSLKLVDVAVQIKEGKDFIPMVLAETLLGLDKVHSQSTTIFSGSPLLLQMWLFEKVKLIAKPEKPPSEKPPKYEARDLHKREIFEYQNTAEGWSQWFGTLKASDINWRCDWIDVPDMTVKNMNFQVVGIAGLTGFTFYIPCRFLRQFGHEQGLPPTESEVLFNPSCNARTLKQYQTSWPFRQKLAAQNVFDTSLKKSYVKWLDKDIKERADKERKIKRKRT